MTGREIEITLNGKRKRFQVKPNDLLLTILREKFGFTGTKYGCGVGECGACTVWVEGKPVLSCLTLAISMDGSRITTIEGLGGDNLDPLQKSFLEHSAVQCGFCTSGMIMTARSLLDENPSPSEEEIRDYIRGNLCRCTGYTSIVKAIKMCGARSPGMAARRVAVEEGEA